ncbi:hypothetical protein KY361_05410 [Candidatus Woesearchaeota archaeon]|nr:hypothetical protein [Candidatus Woesearchaeota archaeon]
MKNILFAILIISLFLFGCAPKKAAEPALETIGVSDVDDVSSEITDIDVIDDDLSGAELDSLEQDLAEIDW